MEKLSVLELFLQADFVVKSVMILLFAASIYSWVIIFAKYKILRKFDEAADNFELEFWQSEQLNNLHSDIEKKHQDSAIDPMRAVFCTAMKQIYNLQKKQVKNLDGAVLAENNISKYMQITLEKNSQKLEDGIGSLAIIGSAAPFIGLFGTVWGIMNSFSAIAGQQSTNLAVVAPGIAEALFATAIGLFAAIPAVIFYNKLSARIDSYLERCRLFSDEFVLLLDEQFSVK